MHYNPKTLLIDFVVLLVSTPPKVIEQGSVTLCHTGLTRLSRMSQVQQFYVGQSVFITGATGFLGGVLLEKLARSCEGIGTIYVLVRSKKGKTVEERMKALIDGELFHVLRTEYPESVKNIVGVAGDITKEKLGLSPTDYARLINEVSIIFHLAATVRFNEPLEAAVSYNVSSVKCVVDMAKACKNFKVGIYVSTAYSHCVRKSIDEELYSPPLSYDEINNVVKDMKRKELSEEATKNLMESVLKGWPNTYSFTKAVAEGVIAEYAKDIPFAVYRPSIVTSAYREPMPGWFSNPIGVLGLVTATTLGIMHVNYVDRDIVLDVVPVDYVCNALIACAWDTAVTERAQPEDIPVYNYISSNDNPTTFGELADKSETYERIYPSISAVYYPNIMSTSSRRLFTVLEFLFHMIPALVFDTVGRLFGKPPRLYKVQCKIAEASRALEYFSTQQWSFENPRVQNLWKKMGSTDRQIFPFDMHKLDWDEYVMRMIRGLRRYIVGEKEDNMDRAKRWHIFLYIIHTIIRLGFLYIGWMIWKLFFAKSVPNEV